MYNWSLIKGNGLSFTLGFNQSYLADVTNKMIVYLFF